MNKRVYNLETSKVEDYEQKHADMIEAGTALNLELPKLNEFERKADELHNAFIAKEEALKTSDNPLYRSNPELLAYELDKLEQQYEADTAELEASFSEWRTQTLKESQVKAAQSYIKVSQADKTMAEQFADAAALELMTATDKAQFVSKLKADIMRLTDGQRQALQSHMPRILSDELDRADKTALVNAVKSVRNADKMALSIAEQMPNNILTKKRIRDIARSVTRGRDGELSGISREDYETIFKK